jgi:hypothetical protein
MQAPGRVRPPAEILRPDYRWEKIIRAVARSESGSFVDAAEWLITQHPEYLGHELPIIRESARLMDEAQSKAKNCPRRRTQ